MSSSSSAAVMSGSIRASGGAVLARDDLAKRAEQLAIRSRRCARGALLARLARQRAQPAGVDSGMRAHQLVDAGLVLDQAVAPALDAVLLRGVLGGNAVPDLELLADRRGVDRAHELADVLHLAPPRLVLG